MVLDYNSANGRRMAVRHTPDFFVLRQDGAGWEEWKTEEDLHQLTEHNPNRYAQESGCWRCPPGEAYATRFGLSYRVRSAKEIHWRLQRNILFIHDHLHTDPDTVPAATRERLLAYIRAVGMLSVADLIQQTAEFATPDDIYLLIAAAGFMSTSMESRWLNRRGSGFSQIAMRRSAMEVFRVMGQPDALHWRDWTLSAPVRS